MFLPMCLPIFNAFFAPEIPARVANSHAVTKTADGVADGWGRT